MVRMRVRGGSNNELLPFLLRKNVTIQHPDIGGRTVGVKGTVLAA
jgi:hypothetical protein